MNFRHIANEVWYSNEASTTYIVCDASGEDPNCADSIVMTSISDHTTYLGISTGCKA